MVVGFVLFGDVLRAELQQALGIIANLVPAEAAEAEPAGEPDDEAD